MNKQRLRLSEDGHEFLTCFRTVIDWLSMGGEIQTDDERRIAMTEEALPGIIVATTVGTQLSMIAEKKEVAVESFILINSDVVWQTIVTYAKRMSFSEQMLMAGNIALNRTQVKDTLREARKMANATGV